VLAVRGAVGSIEEVCWFVGVECRRTGVGMRWQLKCCEIFPRVNSSQARACRLLGKVRFLIRPHLTSLHCTVSITAWEKEVNNVSGQSAITCVANALVRGNQQTEERKG
jgi:hypothetical protein